MKFEHYLLTRFDYKEDYLHFNKRVKLFLEHTLPSVQAQICQNFKWIIKSRNREVVELVSGVENVIVQKDFRIRPKTEWVITTRFDNDDTLDAWFIQSIQEQFDETEKIVDTLGYRLNQRTREKIPFDYYDKIRTSPFISLIEKSKEMRGVMHAKHGEMGQHHKVSIINKRLWVQVIHNCNHLMTW